MSSSVAEAVTKDRLHSSGEDYLKAIFTLEAQHGSVRSVEVAEYMNVSKASVSHAGALLKKNGFLKMNQDYDLVLTDSGRAIASCIYEKHCYFKDRLISAGVSPETAALMAGVGGAALGAGVVFAAKLGNKPRSEDRHHEDEKA